MSNMDRSLRQMPMLILGLSLSIGIGFNHWALLSNSLYLNLIICTLSINLLSNYIHNHLSLSIEYWIVLFGFVGAYSHSIQTQKRDQRIYSITSDESDYKEGQVYNISFTQRYFNIHINLNTGQPQLDFNKTKVLLKTDQSITQETLKIGDHISWSGKLINTCKSSNNNSYYNFLCQKNIPLVGYINPSELKTATHLSKSPYRVFKYQIRQQGMDFIQEHLSENASSIVLALIFGNKNFIDKNVRQNFAKSGTAHVLAVSGMHVGIITMLLLFLFRRIFYKAHKNSWACIFPTIIGIWIFSEISGGAAPVKRASMMAIAYLTARLLSLEYSNLNTLGFIGSILMLTQPSILFDLSFQLSFIAVAGIILIYPIIDHSDRYKNKLIRQICSLVQLGIAAQFAIMPLSLYYFGELSLLSPITSIWSIALVYLIIILGFTLFVVGVFDQVMLHALQESIEITVQLLTESTNIFGQIPCTTIITKINSIECVLLLGAALSLTMAFYNQKKKILLKASIILYSSQSIYHLQQKFV